ncbi:MULTISPECIES: YbaY family lipoprotein [unclassified Brevundimonas]|uniref:YbaY family lipoprotein n=1 Tax=unclassified Brevundimonas TaxID=2622653 RepID=UPI0025C700E2|nr:MULTISPECIES: YbaY family lipoprotein [unclassified Brevundimonas]
MKPQLIALAAVLGLAACGTVPASETGFTQVEVNAAYRERIALPAGHTLIVKVEDVSLADAPSVTLAQTNVPLDGRAPPFRVMLQVPTSAVQPNHTYAASAEIRDSAGKLRFITDTHHGVLTQGQPNAATIVMTGVQ